MEMKEILLALLVMVSGAMLDEINKPDAENYNYEVAKFERDYTSNRKKMESDLNDAIKEIGIVDWKSDDFSSFSKKKSGVLTNRRIQTLLLDEQNDDYIIGSSKDEQEISIKHVKHSMLN